MKNSNINIILIVFNSDVKEFCIERNDKLTRMLFPIFSSDMFLNHVDIIDKFFRLYISDSPENVFLINYLPCETFLKSISLSHPLSKRILIIHDLSWTHTYNGNKDSFVKILNKKQKNEIEKTSFNFFRLERRMYDYANKIVCLSDDTYNLLVSIYGVPFNKLELIPNGLRSIAPTSLAYSTKNIRKELHISENESILLFVGRPTLQKGFYALLKAFEKTLLEFPNVRLVVVGADSNNKLGNLLPKLSSTITKIVFTGLIDKKLLSKWYKIANVGIIPSYYEQCSYTGIEMMMFGLPIIASDGYGIRNMFEDNITAKVAKIGNREDSEDFVRNLFNAIIELLNSKSFCSELSIESRKTFQNKYNSRYMKKKYIDLIMSV
ncbi:glycosyltransferase [Massilibacteroides vaginae]|uniref:glycosyltransferase n=1 Tax=Massilibacteroides vaginae TaxID=1673718 RepID=UPI001592ED18|nr:glycosyltransferase [Massilibacteroides vaginae]